MKPRTISDDAFLFRLRELVVEFRTANGILRAVDGVDLDVRPGETHCIVGETGSGKSVSAMAALGLLPRERVARVTGTAEFAGEDLLTMPDAVRRRLLGQQIATVFQDPMSAPESGAADRRPDRRDHHPARWHPQRGTASGG